MTHYKVDSQYSRLKTELEKNTSFMNSKYDTEPLMKNRDKYEIAKKIAKAEREQGPPEFPDAYEEDGEVTIRPYDEEKLGQIEENTRSKTSIPLTKRMVMRKK